MNLNLNLKRIAAATCPPRADLVSAVLYGGGARKQTYNKTHGLMAAVPCCVNEMTELRSRRECATCRELNHKFTTFSFQTCCTKAKYSLSSHPFSCLHQWWLLSLHWSHSVIIIVIWALMWLVALQSFSYPLALFLSSRSSPLLRPKLAQAMRWGPE